LAGISTWTGAPAIVSSLCDGFGEATDFAAFIQYDERRATLSTPPRRDNPASLPK
jgi:hypothetical protein